MAATYHTSLVILTHNNVLHVTLSEITIFFKSQNSTSQQYFLINLLRLHLS